MVSDFEKGAWALILGGSTGLGLASAKKLSAHGMNICIIHRTPRSMMADVHAEFHKIANRVKFLEFNSDALNPEKRSETIKAFAEVLGTDKIRILVHSIAKGSLKEMGSGNEFLSGDDFRITIDAMAISLYEWTSAIQAAGLFAETASVISFTSEGSTRAWKNYAAVSAAKAALEAISRSIALEFAQFGIRSNCIQAGVTDTAALRAIPGSDEIVKNSTERNPFQRLTTPEDVANIVYLLSRDEAIWINGSVIKVDGGESIR